jgi:hypothetical protein
MPITATKPAAISLSGDEGRPARAETAPRPPILGIAEGRAPAVDRAMVEAAGGRLTAGLGGADCGALRLEAAQAR